MVRHNAVTHTQGEGEDETAERLRREARRLSSQKRHNGPQYVIIHQGGGEEHAHAHAHE